MRCVLLKFLAILALVAVAKLAGAEPVGLWTIDREAMRAQFEAMLERDLQQVPAEARETLRSQARKDIDAMVAGLEGSAELMADGTVIFRDGGGKEEKGRWEGSDEALTLTSGDGRRWLARIEKDRLYVRPAGEPQVPFEMIFSRGP